MAFGTEKTVYTGTRVDQAEFDAGLRAHMLRVYNYMVCGLLLTGILAVVVAHQSARAQDAVSQREEIRSIYRRFAPNKLGALARLFAKYEGAEQELLDSVREKYGVPADDDRTGAEAHRYCIIGAGPAGVQLGHLFMTAAGEREAPRGAVDEMRGLFLGAHRQRRA